MSTTVKSEGKPRGQYSKGIQRRQEILDETLGVVVDRGVHRTSLRAIAETIGVSHTVLTHYFGSREGLLIEVIRQHDEFVAGHVTDGSTVLEGLVQGAAINMQVPGLVALFTNLMATSVEEESGEARHYFRERYEIARRDLVNNLRTELSSSKEVLEVDLENASSLMLAAFDGLQVQWLLDPTVDIAASLKLIQRLL